MQPASDRFGLGDDRAYLAWRERKLAGYPTSLDELIVPVRDPRELSRDERETLARACARANFAIYRSEGEPADKDLPRRLGRQLGLTALDRNWLAGDDGISSVTVSAGGTRGDYIPYTNRPIRWHTDGYYNPPQQRVRAMILHCVSPAAEGGENALLDHEIAYILLRDESPAHVAALMRDDAMTIPARVDNGAEARAAQSGPVFSVDPVTGELHMRYTARTRSIQWSAEPAVASAVACLERLLDTRSPFIHRVTLESGMGVIANNVLHDRSAFTDNPAQPRLLYRARYFDRIAWRNG